MREGWNEGKPITGRTQAQQRIAQPETGRKRTTVRNASTQLH